MELTVDQILRQGIAAHKEGKLEEAEKLYRSILGLQSQHPDASHNLGVLAVSVGKVGESLPYFKTALEANPKIEQFWISYIDALVRLGHLDTARVVLQQGREAGLTSNTIEQLEVRLDTTQATDVSLHDQLRVLMTLYNQGQFKEALVQGNILSGKFPNDPTIPNILGAVYSALGQYEEAITLYNKAIELRPDYAEAHNNLGNTLKELHKYEEAVVSLNKAIELKLENAEVYNDLGNTLKELHKYEEAANSFSKSIELNSGYVEAYNNLGNTFKELGKLEEATENYIRSIELNPSYALAYNNLGSVFHKLASYENAIASFNKAIMLDIGFSSVHTNLGNAYKQIGDYREAIRHYDIDDTPNAKAQSLQCLYMQEDYTEFKERLRNLSKSKEINIRVAAISAFVAHQLKQPDPYPFCKNPIDFFHLGHLDSYTNNVASFVKDIIEEAEQELLIWEPENKATRDGFQTPSTIFQAGRNCSVLGKFIMEEIKKYHSKFSLEDCALIKFWPDQYTLSGWFVRLLKNGYQTSHIHANGWVSGVIYLKTVDPINTHAGGIEIGLHGYSMHIIDKNYPRKIHQPKMGDIILFPSSLFHRTIPFQEDTERCVIAFDIIPIWC